MRDREEEIEKARQETLNATIQAIKNQGVEAVSGISYSELEKQVLGGKDNG